MIELEAIGLEMIGLEIIGLEMIGLIGLEVIGLEMIGSHPSAVRLDNRKVLRALGPRTKHIERFFFSFNKLTITIYNSKNGY